MAEPMLISGSVLISAREAMVKIAGAPVVARAVTALDRDARRDYEGLTPLSWLPVEIGEAVLLGVARELGRDPVALMAEVTRLNLKQTFNTVWRLLLRVTTDEALISRTPILYSKSYSRGQLTSKIVAPGRSDVAVRGWAEISELQIEALRVAVESVLRFAGRRSVSVASVRHPLGASFTALWMV